MSEYVHMTPDNVTRELDTWFISIGRDFVPELRPKTGPLFIPRLDLYIRIILTAENRITRRKSHQNTTLSTTNPKWTEPDASPCFCGDRLATNRVRHGVAMDTRRGEKRG
jgi:hypothetical protein